MQSRKGCQPAQTCALDEGLGRYNCAGQHVIADWGTKISAILCFYFGFLNNQNFNIDR